MTDLEALQLANTIVSPYGLKAEFIGENRSVGVGGDQRTYSRVIVLTRPYLDYQTLASLATEIGNLTGINRITIEPSRVIIDKSDSP
jgi:GMP synthase PP-ATPase subunit